MFKELTDNHYIFSYGQTINNIVTTAVVVFFR